MKYSNLASDSIANGGDKPLSWLDRILIENTINSSKLAIQHYEETGRPSWGVEFEIKQKEELEKLLRDNQSTE